MHLHVCLAVWQVIGLCTFPCWKCDTELDVVSFAGIWLADLWDRGIPTARMGNILVAGAVENEKAKWAAPHSLAVDAGLRDRQLRLLSNFGAQLHICWKECQENGISYKHDFVTDLVWTIEFLSTGLAVHHNPLPRPYTIEADNSPFANTAAVKQRMSMVGATAYFVTLRNCEHLARYIHSGSGVSYQMLKGEYLGSTFVCYMMDEHKRTLNRLPHELEAAPTSIYQLYPSELYRGFLTCEGIQSGLSRADDQAYNVLVVGPAGCGKSHIIINLLFNRLISESRASAHSVTRQIGTGCYTEQGQQGEHYRHDWPVRLTSICSNGPGASQVGLESKFRIH